MQIVDDFKEIKNSLDSSVTTINQELQNTQSKIEGLSREIIDDIKESKTDLDQKMEANRKEIHILKILAFTGIVLAVVIIILKFST